MLVRDYLHRLAGSAVAVSPGELSRAEHVGGLARQAGSDLEREWLEMVAKAGYRLPEHAQALMDWAGTRPDFTYDDARVAVYVDGPHHLYPHRAARDADADDRLYAKGWTAVRFAAHDDWPAIFAKHADTFGRP